MDKKALLGKRIKELRKQKNYTQDYLAEKLTIEPRQLSKLETGKHYPSFETVVALLKIFDITFEELINLDHLKTSAEIKNSMINEIKNLNDEQFQSVYRVFRSMTK